jgi:hypothetical protein
METNVFDNDPDAQKQQLHNKLSELVNNLVEKIQMKHENLIAKQK